MAKALQNCIQYLREAHRPSGIEVVGVMEVLRLETGLTQEREITRAVPLRQSFERRLRPGPDFGLHSIRVGMPDGQGHQHHFHIALPQHGEQVLQRSNVCGLVLGVHHPMVAHERHPRRLLTKVG